MKDNNVILIIGVIILALAFYQYGQSFSIVDSTSAWPNKTISSGDLIMQSRSNAIYGDYTRVCNAGTCIITEEPYVLRSNCNDPQEICGNVEQFIKNDAYILGDSIISNLSVISNNVRLESQIHLPASNVLILENKMFDTDILNELNLDYNIHQFYTGHAWSSFVNKFRVKIYLFNEDRDILVYEIDGTSIQTSGSINIKRNPSGIGYIVNDQSNLQIPIGIYKIAILSIPSPWESFSTSSATVSSYIEISNIQFNNTEQNIEVYRLTNNSCSSITILQNERLTTDYESLNACNLDIIPAKAPTCSDGIQNQEETGIDCGGSCNACPVGDRCYAYLTSTCQETQCNLNYTYYNTLDDCIEEYEGESFLDKYGIPGSVVLIIIITIGIWIIIKKK